MATKDIDLSEFRRIRRAGCNFANLTIKPEHVEVLKAAMQSDDISAAAIHDWMKAHGYYIGKDSVQKHRIGKCVCQ
jgi:hypothetical protein